MIPDSGKENPKVSEKKVDRHEGKSAAKPENKSV